MLACSGSSRPCCTSPSEAGPPSPSLCSHLHVADQIRRFQTKKLTPIDCSWVIFQPGEFPNPVHSVAIGMPTTARQRQWLRAGTKWLYWWQHRYLAGSRSCLKLLDKAEADSWVEPGAICTSGQQAILQKHLHHRQRFAHGFYHLSSHLETDHTTIFPKQFLQYLFLLLMW